MWGNSLIGRSWRGEMTVSWKPKVTVVSILDRAFAWLVTITSQQEWQAYIR